MNYRVYERTRENAKNMGNRARWQTDGQRRPERRTDRWQTDGRRDGRTEKWTDERQTDRETDKWQTDGQRDWQITNGRTERRTDRETDRWQTDGDEQRDGRTSLAAKHSLKFSTHCVKHYTALQAESRETGQRAERRSRGQRDGGGVNWSTTVQCDYNRCTVKQVEPARRFSYLNYIHSL